MYRVSDEFSPTNTLEKVTKLISAAIVIQCYLNYVMSGH